MEIFLWVVWGLLYGEKITYSIEKAIELKLPLIIFSVSGGARMQEGIMSLMQMAKTSSAIARLDSLGILFISVLTDQLMVGLQLLLRLFGDVIVAEPRCYDRVCWSTRN